MYTQTVEGTLTTPEVARLTGITYRQLDYWLRRKIIPRDWVDNPTCGSGSLRRWQPEAVEPLQVVARILDALPAGMHLSASIIGRILRTHAAGSLHLDNGVRLTW